MIINFKDTTFQLPNQFYSEMGQTKSSRSSYQSQLTIFSFDFGSIFVILFVRENANTIYHVHI